MRALRMVFALVAYLLFFIAFLYLVGFVGGLLVPKNIDSGETGSLGAAILINVALIALFGLQHSIMARPGFKERLTRVCHPAIERSVFVLATVGVLAMIFVFWRPLPTLVWSADAEWLQLLLWAMFATGWLIVFVSTWLLNHFELFGLHQAWADFRGSEMPGPQFRTPLFYKMIRHPLYFGFLLAFWSTPQMSQGHLLFAVGMTVYILIAIRYEERDLLMFLGDDYADYRKKVGMLVPGFGKAR